MSQNRKLRSIPSERRRFEGTDPELFARWERSKQGWREETIARVDHSGGNAKSGARNQRIKTSTCHLRVATETIGPEWRGRQTGKDPEEKKRRGNIGYEKNYRARDRSGVDFWHKKQHDEIVGRDRDARIEIGNRAPASCGRPRDSSGINKTGKGNKWWFCWTAWTLASRHSVYTGPFFTKI